MVILLPVPGAPLRREPCREDLPALFFENSESQTDSSPPREVYSAARAFCPFFKTVLSLHCCRDERLRRKDLRRRTTLRPR